MCIQQKQKTAIIDILKTESKDRIQSGKDQLDLKLKELGVTPNSEIFKMLYSAYDVLNKDELYSKIGLGIINLEDLKKIIKKTPAKNVIKYWDLKSIGFRKSEPEVKPAITKIDKGVPFLLRENIDDPGQSYEIAKCCNPIPGDEVTGYLSPGGSIIIHKPKCPVAIRLMSNEGNNIIAVKWTIHKLVSFLARIKMSGIDRIGIIHDITNIISFELNANIKNMNITVNDGIFQGTIDVYIHHTKDLNNLIMKISGIKGIESVTRVEDFTGLIFLHCLFLVSQSVSGFFYYFCNYFKLVQI